MRKLIAVLLICLAIVLCGCSAKKESIDPMVAKWVSVYNDGKSQVLFNFEAIGDLDVVIWDYSDEKKDLTQTAMYTGAYSVDSDTSTITFSIDEGTFVFEYSIEAKKSLTLTYGDKTFTLNFVEQNKA